MRWARAGRLALDLGQLAASSAAVWLLYAANKRLIWLQGTLVPWMNALSERVGDDRTPPAPPPAPIPQPPIPG